GYRVLIAEGSPAVIKLILAGEADAIVGVACLDSLEKMFDKLVRGGVPAMAVPLLGNGCHRTTVDASAVHHLIALPYRPGRQHTASYLPLTRCAARLFEPEELYRVAPPLRKSHWPTEAELATGTVDPIACTESLAYEFLVAGGKYSRPFITLAVYDALTGIARSAVEARTADSAEAPDAVKAVSLATEAFHKASLVHDDVEDDDAFRYGIPALHRRFGAATAINVGDYLIGLGYRLVASQRGRLPSDVVADLVAQFAMAHTRLCEGQGAELIWRDAKRKAIQPLDALKIYALKTAPAFEAALLAGARLAGPVDALRGPLASYARHLGVAYQIVNDLADWTGDMGNKMDRATDLLAGRPTVLWALAMERLPDAGRRELELIAAGGSEHPRPLDRAASLYRDAQVLDRAQALLEKHHARAIEAAAQVTHDSLRRLLHFLADAIVDRKKLVDS
ncbi:MAG: polyprenyl synthetase family protein, partial [Patescibacteria group bacterium]|nr:polyprenyl synthetase family protein [Patescibacteria group bacterium]